MKVLDKTKIIKIEVKNLTISTKKFTMIAGPCSLESEQQINQILSANLKFDILRAGLFKPRTSPYSFQGLQYRGIELLVNQAQKYQKPVISEITAISQITALAKIDILQIGARNMQNYELLTAAAKTNKPILLKRGFSATIDELLASAEYILAQGNEQIILCERGIRTFDNQMRFTLDIGAISLLKDRCNFPIFVDPSHAAGNAKYVSSLAKASVAAGCDGLIIEVHPNPENAKSDQLQQLTIDEYKDLVEELRPWI